MRKEQKMSLQKKPMKRIEVNKGDSYFKCD